MMSPDEFDGSLAVEAPPPGLDLALTALWWAGKGAWDNAHGFVQQDEGNPRCDHVHAFLHRQEGDLDNARYWYRRAVQPVPTCSLDEEWKAIARQLLAKPAESVG
jgi:hypothetical protein